MTTLINRCKFFTLRMLICSKFFVLNMLLVTCRVADPVHFRPDPDPVNQNFKTGSQIWILLYDKFFFNVT